MMSYPHTMLKTATFTTLGVAPSVGSVAELGDLDEEINEIFIKEVIEDVKSINSLDEMKRTALFYSDLKQTEKLMMKGIDPFLKDKNGKMAHQYTRCQDSRSFLAKVIEEFERSERNKSIPLMTEFRIFFMEYLTRERGIKIPDIILNLTVEHEKKEIISEYGVRIVSLESEESKMNLIFQWLLQVIDKTISLDDKSYRAPKKEAVLSFEEFKELFRGEKDYYRNRLSQVLSSFIQQYKCQLMNPFPDVKFKDELSHVGHWKLRMTAFPTKPGTLLRMRLTYGTEWVTI